MDLVERARYLKPMLVDFALSDRYEDERSAVIARDFREGVADQALLTMAIDRFALQHRLQSGTTVVEDFVTAHPELPDAEREMLLGWRDVVEGFFDTRGKDRDAVLLFNFLDELPYRARSNLGRKPFKSLRKGMILGARLVRAGDDWMISGHMVSFPAEARDLVLAMAAEHAMRNPEAVFRNPAKLAEARQILADQHTAFVELFGADLIVVPADEVPGKIQMFHRHLVQQDSPDAEPTELRSLDFTEEFLSADSVAIHFVEGEGLGFYSDYHLLQELFGNPALISRRRYRERLYDFLMDPDTTPDPLRQLAARDPAKASRIFARFLKWRDFSWATDGEELLRQAKPRYFDGPRLPRTVPLSELLTDAIQRSR